MKVSLVAAYDRNRVIGRDNALPWRLPADMRRFRTLTTGKPVIMGRRTFESIGEPLGDRVNIVLTRDQQFVAEGVRIAYSVEGALAMCREAEEVMVIGGGEVYSRFLPIADRLYLTEIDAEFDGDTYFPVFDAAKWAEVERIEHEPDARNPYRYAFVTLERK